MRLSFHRNLPFPAYLRLWVLPVLFWGMTTGCSVKNMAVDRLADALAEGGSTFNSDDDPELVKAAIPFSLKLMETLLAETPRHKGLLYATASGFTQYSYAFVQQEADELEEVDLAAAFAMRDRAKRLYLRARDYGLRGLEVAHPDFEAALWDNPIEAVGGTKAADVPLLYWTAASWGLAISMAKDDPYLIGDQPIVEALIDRALLLDESYEQGAIHTFLITYEMTRVGGAGDPADRARQHFRRALELAGGRQASPYVALAEAVSIPQQNKSEFQRLLKQAIAINADDYPGWRLVNLITQRRARWLLEHTDDLFLE